MDNTEIHYLTFDPEEIFREMQYAFIANGGDVLYPGDEKEIFLRSVQAVMVQAFAGVDNALRMATLRYAVGDYLDIYGQSRGCSRITAQAASATVEIRFRASNSSGILEAGTALTADGERIYALDSMIVRTGSAQTVRASITALEVGAAGNGLKNGTQMQFLVPQEAVESVFCVKDAVGGQEREDDDTYRERIRVSGFANTTTGPQSQYESAAKNVTSQILDARAANLGAGKVGVSLLLEDDAPADAIINEVLNALNADDVRPLTDEVSVVAAEAIHYVLNVQYLAEPGSSIANAVAEAIETYQEWQDSKIGRAFNPDRLIAEVYRAGASRVIFAAGSNFNGGSAEYTEIAYNAHCKGTITLQEMA